MNPTNQQRGPEIIKFINNFDLFGDEISTNSFVVWYFVPF